MSNWEPKLPQGYYLMDHQLKAVDRVFGKFQLGDQSTLCLMPTGAGKTVFASLAIQRGIHDHDWKTLFIAQRRKLVTQAADTFRRFGFVTAIDMAEQRRGAQEDLFGKPDVVVGTVQTLQGDRLREIPKDRFNLIVVDECHHALGSPYEEIMEWFNGYMLLGLTATPGGSKRNLGNRFKSIAYRLKIRHAIEQGVICPIVTRTIKAPVDLRELRVTRGDFSDGELAARILPAVEGLAHNIKINAGKRPTVVFTPDLGTASAMADMLRKQGVSAKYIAGSQGKYGMPERERAQVESEFEHGDFQTIVSCDLLIEGWDCKEVACVAICRPTLKTWRYIQMVGRGFRICVGKDNLLVLDFDWKTDEQYKQLCGPYSLFEDELDGRVKEQVGRKLKSGEEIDLIAEIMKAKNDTKYADEVHINFTGKYAHKWETIESDPVGIGKIIDCKIRQSKELNPRYGGGVATPSQIGKLHSLGVNAWGMSKWGASKLIGKLVKDQEKGLASWQQRRELLKLGVDENQARQLSSRQAASVIFGLARQ